jgi:hypothetical protein
VKSKLLMNRSQKSDFSNWVYNYDRFLISTCFTPGLTICFHYLFITGKRKKIL